MTLPLFKSHYSIGRSILTLEEAETSTDKGPKSIIDICLENDIKELFLVEDGMSGFLQAYENCGKSKIKLVFGIRMTFCNDTKTKTTESISEESKYIIFAKNTEGYRRLIKIYSEDNVQSTSSVYLYKKLKLDLEEIKKILEKFNLEIFDVEELPVHGGSLRIYIKKVGKNPKKNHSEKIEKLLKYEKQFGHWS